MKKEEFQNIKNTHIQLKLIQFFVLVYTFFYEKTKTTTVNKPVHYAQVRWSPKELPHAWTC